MVTLSNKVRYSKLDNSIIFKDKSIVDLSGVPENAKGKVFSGIAEDHTGTEFRLSIDDSHFPFNIQLASFSPAGFVMAVVKNRIEVEGMVTSDEIQHAYDYISEAIRINI